MFGTTEASMFFERSVALMCSPRLLITRCESSRPLTTSAYDATRCCANWLPWKVSAVSLAVVEMNTREVDAYCFVIWVVIRAAMATVTSIVPTMSSHRRRAMRR